MAPRGPTAPVSSAFGCAGAQAGAVVATDSVSVAIDRDNSVAFHGTHRSRRGDERATSRVACEALYHPAGFTLFPGQASNLVEAVRSHLASPPRLSSLTRSSNHLQSKLL